MSTRVEKFQAIHDKQVARYRKCLTIVIGELEVKSKLKQMYYNGVSPKIGMSGCQAALINLGGMIYERME